MKTSLEKIQDDFGVPIEMGIEGVAKGGSLVPQIVEDKGKVCEVTFCDSISGGADEQFNMPRQLHLVRYKWIDGELHEFAATYTITENK